MKADKQKVNRLLKTARGQIDGILRMVEEDRYCMEISQQLMATEAILNKANKEILTAHLKSCVTNARTCLLYTSNTHCNTADTQFIFFII